MVIRLDKYEAECVYEQLRYLLASDVLEPGEHQIVTVDDVTLVLEIPRRPKLPERYLR